MRSSLMTRRCGLSLPMATAYQCGHFGCSALRFVVFCCRSFVTSLSLKCPDEQQPTVMMLHVGDFMLGHAGAAWGPVRRHTASAGHLYLQSGGVLLPTVLPPEHECADGSPAQHEWELCSVHSVANGSNIMMQSRGRLTVAAVWCMLNDVLVCWQQAADAPAKERKRTRAKSKERTDKAPKEKRSRHHRDRGALSVPIHLQA